MGNKMMKLIYPNVLEDCKWYHILNKYNPKSYPSNQYMGNMHNGEFFPMC